MGWLIRTLDKAFGFTNEARLKEEEQLPLWEAAHSPYIFP